MPGFLLSKHRTISRVLLALGSLVVTFGCLEVFARAVASKIPDQLGGSDPLTAGGFQIADPILFWRYAPNLNLVWDGLPVKTNRHGYRDTERSSKKPPGVFRILSLGESTTFGDRVEQDETYSYQLERALNADTTLAVHVEVWNCGVCAYSTYQSLQWLESEGFDFEPDMVLFYHEMNDYLPTFLRSGAGRILGLGRTDRQVGAACRRLGPLVALAERSRFYRWLRVRFLLMAAGGARPGSAVRSSGQNAGTSPATIDSGDRTQESRRAEDYAVALRTNLPWAELPAVDGERVWPDTLPLMTNPNRLCRVPDSDRARLLAELVRVTRARGVDLIVIHPAYPASVPHRCVLTEIAASESVAIVDFERVIRESGLSKADAFVDFFHPTPAGHALLAEALADLTRSRIALARPNL